MEESTANNGNRGEDFSSERIEEALTPEETGFTEIGDGGAAAPEDSKSSSSSSSDDDDDSDSDDDVAVELQIKALEQSLSENPFNYDAHVQYIQHLRKLGKIERLQEAREAMNEKFPLTPAMWQEWAKDETSLISSSEDFGKIEKIYERGLHEYLSVPLWCEYIEFVQENDPLVSECSAAGISKMRALFERALTAAGLHVVEGNKVWEAYREYEQAILLTISEDNNEEKAKQINHVCALFHRQLSVPLVDLQSTLMAYKVWEVEQGNAKDVGSAELDGIPSNVVSSYQKAVQMYNARSVYEDHLSSHDASDADKLQHFMNYIKFEESSGDPARVQILYERAVAELPVSSDMWLAYTSYLDNTLKVPNVLKNVYSRATKNCTWVGELWLRYLLSLERIHASEEELSAVFEKSIQCAFPSFKEYMDLFLTRVDGLRRRISAAGTNQNDLSYTLIRDTFQRAVDYLSPQLVATTDLLRLHAYWARLEANLGKNLVAARGLWESLIKKSGSMLEVWQSYIGMEIEMGHISEARSIYKRCYSKRFPGSGSEDICYSWLQFEREYGTLDDYDLAMKKVTPRLQELTMFRMQQDPKISNSAQIDGSVANDSSKKRKMSNTSKDTQSPAKKQKGSAPKHTKRSGDIHDVGANDKAEEASLLETSDALVAGDKPIENSTVNESKPKVYNDQCTAFVSNLSFKANEGHLRGFFSDCGGVTAVRILKDKFTGKSRGLAYVDFSDEENLKAAIAKNKQKLLEQRVSVARSDPFKGKRKELASGQSAKGRDREQPSKNDNSSMAQASDAKPRERTAKPKSSTTFAAPRSVIKPLGWTDRSRNTEESSEQPKSNDEFRKMLLKK